MHLPAETIKFRLKCEAGLTIRDVARQLERHPSTVSLVLHGIRRSRPVVLAIAEILGDDPDDLTSFLDQHPVKQGEFSS